MQLSGLLHGAKLLRFVNFPVPEVLGPNAMEPEIKAMIIATGWSSSSQSSEVPLARRAKRA